MPIHQSDVFIYPGPKVPSYARETMTSRQHTREDLFSFREISKPDALELKSRSDLGGSMVSEEPLIDQERRKDEEYLVIIAYLFVYLTKTTT